MPHTIERRDFLAAFAGVAIGARTPRAAALQPTFMYVGSYTSKGRGHGDGISVYQRKDESQAWALAQVVSDFADPSFLTIDRRGRCLYSAHGDGTVATAYEIDQSTGRLKVLNQQATGGTNGVHLAIDATGRFLALANYATGTLALLRINPDGSLGERTDLAAMTGEPGPHRIEQVSSHPHHCPFDPAGRYVVVPDKGLDRVFVYRVDTERGTLVPASPASVASRPGAAPRHIDFHPTRPYAYVINELNSTMTAYRFDLPKGIFEPFQIESTLPSSYTGNNSTAEIVVHPSGRFVYGSNRGHDSIVIFAIDPAIGGLTVVGWESTRGRTPRYFGLEPSGARLYAANQNSDTIVVFDIDRATGKLAATNEVVKVASPTTIVFR